MRLIGALALSLCAALFATTATAQKVPALAEVNPALSDPPRAQLDTRRAALASTRASLRDRIQKYDDRCLLRQSGSQADRECPGEKVGLETDRDAYAAGVKSFNWDLEQAVGEYRMSLEKRILDMDLAIKQDAEAVARFGFSRRADDFDKWAQLSKEAQGKAIGKIAGLMLEAGVDEMRNGISEQLLNASGAEIDRVLLSLRAAGLGAGAAAESLRRYKETKDKQLLRSIAMQLNEELRSAIKIDEAGRQGNNFEAAWETLQMVVPPGMRQVLVLGETAAWATYSIGMQTVAVVEVQRLNKLTTKELAALHNIQCLFENHVLERYHAKVKLAELTGRGPSELSKPVQSNSCKK